jgi:hypothetical protein
MTMDCRSVTDIVERWRDGEPPSAAESRAAREHAASCPSCREAFGVVIPLMRRDAEGYVAPLSSPALEEQVMGRVARRAPRVVLPRAGVLAVAASIALVIGVGIGLTIFMRGGAPAGTMEVTFTLDTPAAQTVALVGDFNNWKPGGHLLVRRPSDGTWSITVRLVQNRTYVYSFLVDGNTWVPDPAAESVDDGFGGIDSILRL